MKKIAIVTLIAAAIMSSPSTANAQAWHKGVKVFSVGMGASSFLHFWGEGYYDYYGYYYYDSWFTRITGQLNLQGEFGIHKYVGIGFTTGLGFAGGYAYASSEVNFPVGAVANFHFWQLIDDKVSSDMHSGKLDVYGGASIGSGIAILSYGGGSDGLALLFVGPHVGARYYFNDVFGVNAEMGYGKVLINGGIVLKID